MSILSYAQLKGLWLRGSEGTRYHTAAWATLMAAIAEAESGGNTDALNPSDNNGTQSSFGLWQISNGTHAAPSPNWADPSEQVRLAIGKLDSQGVTAWGTYDSGAYKAYMNGATAPDPNIPGNPTGQQAQLTAAQQIDCLMQNPFNISVPDVGQIAGGPQCLITKSNARAFIGAGLMGAGIIIALPGIGMIMVGTAIQALTPLTRDLQRIPLAGQYVSGRAIGAGISRTPPRRPPSQASTRGPRRPPSPGAGQPAREQALPSGG